jgi:hypothetical protein
MSYLVTWIWCRQRACQRRNIEEYSVWETPHSSTPPSSMDDGKLQWILCDCLGCGLDRPRESFSKLWAYFVVPSSRFD